jgi:hypothetical protein
MQIFKTILVFTAGLVVGALVTNYLLDKEQSEILIEEDLTSNEVTNTDILNILNENVKIDDVVLSPNMEASFKVENQLAGESVFVKEVKMPQAGWVVVHEVLDGFVANALGATRIDAGEYDVVVVELLRPSIPESDYVVTLYADDGNKQFEINSDSPMIDTKGDAIFKEFETASGSAS